MTRLAKAHLAGLVTALVAAPIMLVLVLVMNRAAGGPTTKAGRGEVSFQVRAQAAKPRRAARSDLGRQERRPSRQGPRAALPAAPTLGPDLSGMDVGTADFALEPLERLEGGALGDLEDLVHTEDTVDTRPTPRVTTPIEVPAAAKARNLSGRVVLSLRIGADGAVRSLKVLESEPPGVFDDAALQAVREWEFEPATYHGAPVEVWATLPIEFSP